MEEAIEILEAKRRAWRAKARRETDKQLKKFAEASADELNYAIAILRGEWEKHL